jgi:hypothetical protein
VWFRATDVIFTWHFYAKEKKPSRQWKRWIKLETEADTTSDRWQED